MQYALFDFLGPPLIPELSSDVAAGSARHAHLILVTVSAVGALPHQLAVLVSDNFDFAGISAFLAVIAFCIQLSVQSDSEEKAETSIISSTRPTAS